MEVKRRCHNALFVTNAIMFYIKAEI